MKDRRIAAPLGAFHARIRARFPMIDRDALGNPRIYLNTGAGSLTVDKAGEAAREAQGCLNPMPGSIVPGERVTAELHDRVRSLAADFLQASSPLEISFHASATAALFSLAFALRGRVPEGANLIVTDIDHMANISPWETAWGELFGRQIRRAKVREDGTLDEEHLLSLVDGRTAVLAVTSASNGLGTLVPLGRIAPAVRAKAPGCLIAVDAVHHAPHGPIDVREMGCDFLVFSGYKVFGPMLGILWGKGELLERILPYRVETAKNEAPFKFEAGMLNNASLASLEAALEYVLWLADLSAGAATVIPDRAAKFRSAMSAVAEYEKDLTVRVLEGFRRFDQRRFRCFGITDPARAAERVPTFAFEIAGQDASETKKRLWEARGLQIADGNHYSAVVVRHLGRPALCRASFAHYDDAGTVDAFLEGLRMVLEESPGNL
jgi:selenocysteine lyase/cysteine desulfurase